MNCKPSKCRASCCHNIPLPLGYLQRFADKIVNEVLYTEHLGGTAELPDSELAVTSENLQDNRCPFLKRNCKCAIYADRPQICRMFGETDHPLMKCRYLNQK